MNFRLTFIPEYENSPCAERDDTIDTDVVTQNYSSLLNNTIMMVYSIGNTKLFG